MYQERNGGIINRSGQISAAGTAGHTDEKENWYDLQRGIHHFYGALRRADFWRFHHQVRAEDPLFCQHASTGNYKTGAQAAKLGDYYAACIQENMPGGIDCLFGPAYKGIPLAVSAAASLYRNYGRDLPYCFNRKEVKDHGEGGS